MFYFFSLPVFFVLGLSFLYRQQIIQWFSKLRVVGSVVLKQIVYILALKYNYVSGRKRIHENLDVAEISYNNANGHVCTFNVPFYKKCVSNLKNVKFILWKEGSKGYEYQDITHEPGLPYLLSPHDLAGKEIRVFAGNRVDLRWDSKWSLNVDDWRFVRSISNKQYLNINDFSTLNNPACEISF